MSGARHSEIVVISRARHERYVAVFVTITTVMFAPRSFDVGSHVVARTFSRFRSPEAYRDDKDEWNRVR